MDNKSILILILMFVILSLLICNYWRNNWDIDQFMFHYPLVFLVSVCKLLFINSLSKYDMNNNNKAVLFFKTLKILLVKIGKVFLKIMIVFPSLSIKKLCYCTSNYLRLNYSFPLSNKYFV